MIDPFRTHNEVRMPLDRPQTYPQFCPRMGVYCTKCRFRMLPSALTFDGDKTYYCVPCGFGLGCTSGKATLLADLLAPKDPKQVVKDSIEEQLETTLIRPIKKIA